MHVHDVFHLLMLRKCTPDLTWVIDLQDVYINQDTSYLEKPLQILEAEEHRLKNKLILIVKL